MRRVGVLSCLFVLVALSGVSAETLIAEYVDGTVEIEQADGWVPVAIGDNVDTEATLRLADASSIELTSPTSKITLTEPGSYRVGSLLSASRDLDTSGVGRLLAQKVGGLLAMTSTADATVAGVRGAQTKERPEVRWEVDDATSYVEAGKKAIEERDYDRALLEFQSAREYASPAQSTDIAFYISYTRTLKGDLRQALLDLADAKPAPDAATSGRLVLLKGELLVETYAFNQAVDWLSSNETSVGRSVGDRQLYHLLLALAYQGLSDPARTKSNLAAAIDLGPTTDVGRAASKLLEQ